MPNFESGDRSIPSIQFSEAEREKWRAEGKTEKEIDEFEARRNLDLLEETESKLRKELEGGIDQAA